MKNNKDYKVEALLQDEFFVRWVNRPDEQSDHYWKGVLERNPELRKPINRAREIINLMQYERQYALEEGEYSHMLDTLIKENRHANYHHPIGQRTFPWVRIAASIALLIAVGWAVFFFSGNNAPGQQADSQANKVHKQTNKGEKLTIKLADGTMVKLNAISSIHYQAGFSEETREVYLEGEAYFEVAHDASRPFIIHSGNIKTTVLGTKFNVRSYPEEENIEVAVVEGKVKVGYDALNYEYLTPNEVSVYKKANTQLRKTEGNVDNMVAWHKNILIFDNATPEEVWKRLENWYGVNIIIENTQNIKGRYSGIYRNKPLETILRGISFASGFEFEFTDQKTVIIK